MIKSSVIFRADIFSVSEIGTKDQQQDLIKQIEEARKNNPAGESNSNSNCWRSSFRYQNIDWLIDSMLKLYRHADELYKSENDGNDVFNVKTMPILNYWTNVNGKHSKNVIHSHTKSHFSCVYYLQGYGTGELKFVNPANILGNCEFSAPFVRDFYYQPKDGDLILWPAWVPHEVETNFSDRERINIVFDIGAKIL
jgi:uncharacterized protein (TIGR02466 family)